MIERVVLHGIGEQLSAPHLVDEFIQVSNDEVCQINSGKAWWFQPPKTGYWNWKAKKRSWKLRLPPPGFHVPNLTCTRTKLYRRKIDRLEEALNDPEVQQQAAEIIHSLVDHIEIKPNRLEGGSPDGGDDCPQHQAPTQ